MPPQPPIDIDSPAAIARDIAAVDRIGAVPALLKVICESTGMRFAAVARVTDNTWTACAVRDDLRFGLQPGGQLELNSTLCIEAKRSREPIVFNHASMNARYRDHHTPRTYNIESYISIPIVLPDGEYFGNLCAIDPMPADIENERTVNMFKLFAELVSVQLANERKHAATEIALTDAHKTAELREQFIAVLGHDLRNPMSMMGMAAQVLQQRQGDATLLKLGGHLQRAVRRMSGLIDDVLDFTRGRMGGGIGVQLQAVPDLDAALRDVVQELESAHPERSILACSSFFPTCWVMRLRTARRIN